MTFARKYVAEQSYSFVFRQELNGSLLASPKMLETLINGNPAVFKATLERLMASSENLSPQALYSREPESFAEDLQFMQLRRILTNAIHFGDQKVRELGLQALCRFGVTRASAEDLLLAVQLSLKHRGTGIDFSSEI